MTSNNHFVVSNYNSDPTDLLNYANSYTLFDQSDLPAIRHHVRSEYPNAIQVQNCGHSLRNFFDFVISNYSDLPPVVAFLKGNLIDRHVTEKYFEKRIVAAKYTPLFFDPQFQERPGVVYHVLDGLILEVNNSWFIDRSRRPYVGSANTLLRLLYVDPVVSDWLVFAPGGCYIVPRANLAQVPRPVYEALAWLSSYEYFPPEAYIIERLMHTFFTSNYEFNSWCYNRDSLIEKIVNTRDETRTRTRGEYLPMKLSRIRKATRAATNYYRFH